jgi:hypothetical protein
VVGGAVVGGTVVGGAVVGGTVVGTVVAGGAWVVTGAAVVADAHAAKIMLLIINREINCNVIFFMFFSYFIAKNYLPENLGFNLIDV